MIIIFFFWTPRDSEKFKMVQTSPLKSDDDTLRRLKTIWNIYLQNSARENKSRSLIIRKHFSIIAGNCLDHLKSQKRREFCSRTLNLMYTSFKVKTSGLTWRMRSWKLSSGGRMATSQHGQFGDMIPTILRPLSNQMGPWQRIVRSDQPVLCGLMLVVIVIIISTVRKLVSISVHLTF